MVTVRAPVAAVPLAVNVNVLVVAVLEGLKLAVTPPARPEAERLTLPLKPFAGVTVIVEVTLFPRLTAKLAGEAERLKSGTTGALTVRVNVVVRVRVPEAPLTVSGKVPVAAALPTVSVSVLAEVALAGLKFAVTPEGKPEIDRFTVPLKPLTGFTLMVLVPILPCVMVNEFGEADRVKSGTVVFQTSVMGETLALCPACGSPYRSSKVRRTLKWLITSPN